MIYQFNKKLHYIDYNLLGEKRLFTFSLTEYVDEDIFLRKFRELVLNGTKFDYETKNGYQTLSFDVYLTERRDNDEIKRKD